MLLSTMSIIIAIGITGCRDSRSSNELENAASDILRVSEDCLYDVRDNNIKYEASDNCKSLGRLSDRYIDAGGFQDGAPVEIEIKYTQARLHAWMALSLSVSNGQASRIW